MKPAMRQLILRTNGIALGCFAIFGFIMDLLGYFAGIGTWQNQMLNNPNMIGFLEAHGLALLVAVLLFRSASSNDRRAGHLLGMMTHILLGTANLIFWQIFLNANQLPLAYISTSFHWIFVALNGLALVMNEQERQVIA